MDPVTLLQDLVAIPSVNPMGRDFGPDEPLESRLSDHLTGLLTGWEIPHERIEVAPKRANIVARISVSGSDHTILLDAHQDTVPVDGMTIAPFDPVVRDGKLYGRGACDVKGGMAAMLAAFHRLHRDGTAGCNVVLSLTCDEEATQLGVTDVVALWQDGNHRSQLLPSAPDVAIIAEPTELDVVVAHRGATRWKIRTTGRACHSSDPTQGVNAIYRMGRLLAVLEEYAQQLPASKPAHPLCGPATLSVGRIGGGVSVNTVPDTCEIEIDRRVRPGEDGLAVMDEVHDYLRQRLDFDFEIVPPWIVGLTLSDDLNQKLADELLAVIEAVAGPHRALGVPYGTHASRFDAAGVRAVVFGPGSIEQAHTKDEHIDINQLKLAAEVYYRYCLRPEPA